MSAKSERLWKLISIILLFILAGLSYVLVVYDDTL